MTIADMFLWGVFILATAAMVMDVILLVCIFVDEVQDDDKNM